MLILCVSTLQSWVIISQVAIESPKVLMQYADFAWTLVSWHSGIFEYRVWHLLRSCGHRRGYIYGSLVISSGVSSIFGSGYDILSIFGLGSGIFVVY